MINAVGFLEIDHLLESSTFPALFQVGLNIANIWFARAASQETPPKHSNKTIELLRINFSLRLNNIVSAVALSS